MTTATTQKFIGYVAGESLDSGDLVTTDDSGRVVSVIKATPVVSAGYWPGTNVQMAVPSRALGYATLNDFVGAPVTVQPNTTANPTQEEVTIGYVKGTTTNLNPYQSNWTYEPRNTGGSFLNDALQRPFRGAFDISELSELDKFSLTPEQVQKLKEGLEAYRRQRDSLKNGPVIPFPSPETPRKPAAEKKKFIGIDEDVDRDLEVG